MDMQGSRQLAVTRQQAWDALNDPEVLKACIPGCSSLEATGDNTFALVNAVKVGPVSAKFKSTLTLSDIKEPESYTIRFEGDGGPAGFGKGSAQVKLTEQDGGCELAYTVNASVGGKIAQVGQRLIDGVARSMAEKFFSNFDEEIQKRHPSAAAPDRAQDAPAAAARKEGRGLPKWTWIVLAIIFILGVVWAVRV
ncbi:MAG: carbon monoxide dehydrogenase subunit G [Ottowia sp.]|nr:carbon monoxide dehydrogenase subunit G [Ottowia sp.]